MCNRSVRGVSLNALVLVASLGLAACNVRFDADFEADTPGNPPARNPPGFADDEIDILTSNVPAEGIVIRVTDEADAVPAGRPHRFMSLMHEPNPGASSVASLRTAQMATGMQSIFAQWEQVLDGGGSGIVIFATFTPNAPIEASCRVATGNDIVTLVCGSSEEQITGIDTHSVHTVLMRIDRAPRRAVLQVVQGGSTTSPVTIQSDGVPSPLEGQRLAAQIEHTGQSNSAYRINSFNVQERDPN